MNRIHRIWKPFGTLFTFGLRVIRGSLFLIFLPAIFLSLAFQIQWQKNDGQENEATEQKATIVVNPIINW
jgi:hypothetical protein